MVAGAPFLVVLGFSMAAALGIGAGLVGMAVIPAVVWIARKVSGLGKRKPIAPTMKDQQVPTPSKTAKQKVESAKKEVAVPPKTQEEMEDSQEKHVDDILQEEMDIFVKLQK